LVAADFLRPFDAEEALTMGLGEAGVVTNFPLRLRCNNSV